MAFLNPHQIDQIQDALMSRDRAACMVAEGLIVAAKDSRASPALLDRAGELHASDDIEIDDVAGTSASDKGTWVQAWVWVPRDETGEDEEDDGCPVSDPECLGNNGDCHDACESPDATDQS